ncbi:HAD-IA family hydrolase [Sphingomonas jaspsi]|uniref:HAD-IA family hydrolase n=1 Tax=Sphingomonas jaspsi TaxID=392409 RepID=UPI0004B6CBE6|nr:HAD-IA family hydrolase [Sphingomonas jaspsi]
MIRLAIFDCDGTLVDSGASIHRAVEAAFAAHGLVAPPREEAKKVIGLSLDQAMQRLAPGADHDALTATYKDAFFAMRGAGELEEPLFDGIAALLDRMEADGWLLGVATGKSMRGLRHVLELHGLERRFVTLQTADNNPSKPHPAMAMAAMADVGAEASRTIFVGDTAWDMGCAVNAGAGAIGAGWGYHEPVELIDAGAHGVAMTPADVVAHAADWLGRN